MGVVLACYYADVANVHPKHGARSSPTEKIPGPSFNFKAPARKERSEAFLWKAEAWEMVTQLPGHHRGIALYSALKDKAWVEAEDHGAVYCKAWIRERCMDVEVIQVGRIMSQFLKNLRRGNEQSVPAFTGEFDRLVARLSVAQVTLPETVLA